MFLAWHKAATLVPIRSVAVDIGQNLTLACAEEDALPQSGESVGVMWIREGREDGQIERLKVEPNGALQLINVSADDAGNYSCTLDDDHDAVKTRINVQVRSKLLKFKCNSKVIAGLYCIFYSILAPPPALHNVWVKPSTILANILWEVAGTGGYPIIDFTAEYRLKPNVGEEPEDWKPIVPTHIPPNSVNNFSFNEISFIPLTVVIKIDNFIEAN